MAVGKIRIQDIADSLGLSRNTVSKAINGTGILAEETRRRVLLRAKEMGYKQFAYLELADHRMRAVGNPPPSGAAAGEPEKNEVALLTGGFIDSAHFANAALERFQKDLSARGYSLVMHRLLAETILRRELPASFSPEKTAAIVCVELFDHAYSEMLCALPYPTLFIDSPVIGLGRKLKSDCIYMENQSAIYELIRRMKERGLTRFGFVGEHLHCQSFYERYAAFRAAMALNGLAVDESCCILERARNERLAHAQDYPDFLRRCLRAMPALPEFFLCANDFIAVEVMRALQAMNLSVPGDVALCGFDDSREARLVTPALSSVRIHSRAMGAAAARMLFARLAHPHMNYCSLYVETDLVLRASAER